MFQLLKEKFIYFWRWKFVRDTATLEIGNFLGTGIGIITSIVFARVLGPQNYGLYALVFSLASLISIFMNVGASQAVLTLMAESYAKRSKEEVKNILTYFLKITLVISLTIGLLGIILAPFIALLLNYGLRVGELVRIVLFGQILGIAFGLIAIVLQVSRKIKDLAILENLEKLVRNLIMILLVAIGFGILGIATGYFISALLFLIISGVWYEKLSKKDELLPSLKELIYNLPQVKIKKYFKFGFLIALDKNLAQFYNLAPVILLGALVASKAEVGFFKIAFSYVSMPLMFLGPISRLLNVQLPKAKTYGIKILKEQFLKVSAYSMFITLGLAAFFALLASFLVKLLYGKEYLISLSVIYILSIYAAFIGLEVGIGPIYRALNKMGAIIKINLSLVTLEFILGYFFTKSFGFIGAAWVTTIIFVTSTLITFFYALKIIKDERY